jgi:hypothetical protein
VAKSGGRASPFTEYSWAEGNVDGEELRIAEIGGTSCMSLTHRHATCLWETTSLKSRSIMSSLNFASDPCCIQDILDEEIPNLRRKVAPTHSGMKDYGT